MQYMHVMNKCFIHHMHLIYSLRTVLIQQLSSGTDDHFDLKVGDASEWITAKSEVNVYNSEEQN